MRYNFIFLLLLILVSCGEEIKEEPEFNWTKENSTDFGHEVAIQEEIDIKLFLERHKDWNMTKTGSGLQYYIYRNGDKDTSIHAQSGDFANIEYVVTTLRGDTCAFTESDEFERFVVDNSEVESGLQEGIKLLSPGDRARLIIPSHLAHGVAGDMNEIPPLTTLVFDLHLISIIKR